MSAPTPKLTTFLTQEEHRAPSAYHVDEQGDIQRARQEHAHGPTVTSQMPRVQAFVQDKQQARAVANVVIKDSQQLQVRPDQALRLAMLDGLASPRVSANKAHLEASQNPVGRGNPHISGGLAKFPEQGSPLEDFQSVADLTVASRKHWEDSGHTEQFRPITATVSNQITPTAQAFNQHAMEDQRRFAASLFQSGVPDSV